MAFRELRKLNRFIESAPDFVRVEKLAEVKARGLELPIYGIVIGPEDKTLPTFGLFGGVHGLEKIGSHVVINHLKYLSKQMLWDESLKDLFTKCRLVSIPIINPAGMCFNMRSNISGVDLMRNAPVEAETHKFNLVSGHNISPKLPWYRGNPKDMELESQTLINFVRKEMFSAELSVSLDVHSGFGMRDRIWYPYSKSKERFPLISEVKSFINLLEESMAYNMYIIEPQTDSYVIKGDLWDYLFDLHYKEHQGKQKYIPWTLELGSWSWVRKNPLQAFATKGFFNPIRPHRYDRIMRRHRFLLDFLQKTVTFNKKWAWDELDLT